MSNNETIYIGSGKVSEKFPDLVSCSINLDDIPKWAIEHSRNGKDYVNFAVSKRRELGKYGETHNVFVSRKADDSAPVSTKKEKTEEEELAEIDNDLPF